MSFKDRLESLANIQLTALETAEPYILTQDLPPTQKDWEDAWVASGNTLPIPSTQELYWYDGTQLRGEFKTLSDQFCLLSKSLVRGFEIRDIAGWADDTHIFVFIVRDDPNAPQGACRMYMDGTLEELSLTGFSPDGVLAYDVANDYLWYYEGNDIKYIEVATESITTVATVTGGEVPEWRFFVILGNGSGDAYYGAQEAGDPNRSLYYWSEGGGTSTRVQTTFNPGTGAVNADRPLIATTNYVYLSEGDSRSAFDGNLVHQLERGSHTYEWTINLGVTGDEIHYFPYRVEDFNGDEIDFIASHLLPDVLPSVWRVVQRFSGIPKTLIDVGAIPYAPLLQTLRSEINDHNLDYHVPTKLYRDPSFIADGGDEVHFNSVSGVIENPSGTSYLIHDLGWHTWTENNAPDIWVYGATTNRIYRISEWEQFDTDVIVLAEGISTGVAFELSVADIPSDYRLIEIIAEAYTTTGGTGVTFNTFSAPSSGSEIGGKLVSDDPTALQINSVGSGGDNSGRYFSELTTNASIRHLYIFLDGIDTNRQIRGLGRSNTRTNFVHGGFARGNIFCEGYYTSADVITLQINYGANLQDNRYMIRAWRTEPRQQINGSEYDPHMA